MKKWIVALFLNVLILTGCGLKGPLYLPEETAENEEEQ